MHKIIYVGDCGIDLLNSEPILGGCALNVTHYLRKLNQQANVLTWIGNDKNSKLVENFLNKIKVDKRGIKRNIGTVPTQKIVTDLKGEKQFLSYEEGVLKNATIEPNDIKFINEHNVLITIYFSQIKKLFETVTKLNFKGTKIVDFMNMSDFNYEINFVESNINHFDIALFGLSLEQSDLIEQLKELAEKYKKLLIITLGKDGSLVIDSEREYKMPAKQIKVLDTTGCGDAYLAAFLSEYLNSKNIKKAMENATELSAKVAQIQGTII